LPLADPTMPAKLVAKVHAPPKEVLSEYRLDVYGNPQIGQWFEVGSAQTNWPGAMFGVEGAEINFHAVGPKGSLPSQTVLQFAQKGLKMSLGGKEYIAWAVQNELNPQVSYFRQSQRLSRVDPVRPLFQRGRSRTLCGEADLTRIFLGNLHFSICNLQ